MIDSSHVASISFGATRKFQIRHSISKKKIGEYFLDTGSLFWMKPGFQEIYQHQVPKEIKINKPRINLTFRRFRKDLK
jgi:alkylated DNA repair dioxygenase AlkB